VLQVSPTDSAVALTRKTAAVPGSPDRYYESLGTYGRTFARLVPTTDREAGALVQEMTSLGIRTVHIESDGGDYGAALAAAVAAHRASLAEAPSVTTADAVLYAGGPGREAANALNAAAASNPKVRLFVPSALADPAFVATLSPAAQRALYASAAGLPPSGLPPAALSFASQFRLAYGHLPAGEALFGYAAMQAVIDALVAAGPKASNRGTVVSRLIGQRVTDSVLGAYSIDKQGDTSFDTFVIERVRRGKLVAVRALAG
jgi:ABC-type branched-subunit amino acid transport system substrate-binding protein